MAKTVLEKVSSPSPDVSIFRVGGKLGFHENEVLTKFFAECEKRNISKLVFDFSGLGSLGGGAAKIIRKAAAEGRVLICIAGASTTVKNFLDKDGTGDISFAPDVQAALDSLKSRASAPAHAEAGAGNDSPAPLEGNPGVICLGSDEGQVPDEPPPRPGGAAADDGAPPDLRKKLHQYRSLFSINTDFNKVTEKSKLIDVFLLTTMAQMGVDSAAFLENRDNAFIPVNSKGIDIDDLKSVKVGAEEFDLDKWRESAGMITIVDAPMVASLQRQLKEIGFGYVAPFVVHGHFRGLVLLGNPIRKQLDQDSLDFLSILITLAALSYENTYRFQEESQRTLGLVHTLISMIEENTISRGNTELISDYVYSMALKTHYPEEHIKDLMCATVLRDIGMIKVSDLIVRSPRELMKEEWEIIKRHPIDGAEMLRKMKFSEHTCSVVQCHHERFNGEGYPGKLQGTAIPQGARIVSVVESYTAMLQDRPNRPALTREEALNTLKENWGLRYDPEVVKAFVDIVEEEIRTGDKVKFDSSRLFDL